MGENSNSGADLASVAETALKILDGFGDINKQGSSKMSGITNATSSNMLSFDSNDGVGMQSLISTAEPMAHTIPGGSQVIGGMKIADGLQKGDMIEVLDGATDFIPGVAQTKTAAKQVLRMGGH